MSDACGRSGGNRGWMHALVGLAAMAAASAALAWPAGAQQGQWHEMRGTNGAWDTVCEKAQDAADAEGGQNCVMLQPIVDESQPDVGLLVVVMKTAAEGAGILRVLAPLGALLPRGMDIHVDERSIGRTYFARCFEDGCWVMVEMDRSLLDVMKGGNEAIFTIYDTPENGIGIPVDLDGFTAAFDALPATETSLDELLGEGSLAAAPRSLLVPREEVQSSHGAWELICDGGNPAAGQCAIVQPVVEEAGAGAEGAWPKIGISVLALNTPEGGILRILAPLGVLLPHGLGLTVDGTDIGRTYFVRCSLDACYAEVALDEELMGALSSAKEAIFIVFEKPGEGIGIPVDLAGFDEAFGALPR